MEKTLEEYVLNKMQKAETRLGWSERREQMWKDLAYEIAHEISAERAEKLAEQAAKRLNNIIL